MSDYRILPDLGIIVTDQGGIYRVPAAGSPALPVLPAALPQRDDGRGYLCVDLTMEGKRKTMKVHRLVMEAFCGNMPNGYHIDHVDHDKTNNRLSNLRWRKISENSSDCRKTSRAGSKALTQPQLAALTSLIQQGWGTAQIAKALNIGESTVRRHKKNSALAFFTETGHGPRSNL